MLKQEILKFLNVDLDIRFNNNLDNKIRNFLRTEMIILHDEADFLSAELYRQPSDENVAILEFFSKLSILNDIEAKIKLFCNEIIFNIGYELINKENKENKFELKINRETISAIKNLGAELAVTIYNNDR